jgi:transposase
MMPHQLTPISEPGGDRDGCYDSRRGRRKGRVRSRDRYLRCLLTHGARAVLRAAHQRATMKKPLTRLYQWALTVQTRRGHNKAAIAVANKLGRIVWAVWHHDVPFAAVPAA